MKFAPVTPADLQFDADGLPVTARFADVYHARAGALEQADAVFLGGNGLPHRWQGRERFVILETGLGLAHNFLATWRAWRNDPQRCRRLHYVGIDRYPVLRGDLIRAHRSLGSQLAPDQLEALHAQWPIATPDLHRLVFEGGRVVLDCVWADVLPALRDLRLRADAVYLDGFSPRRNHAMWNPEVYTALAHRLQADATAATWSASRGVREGLERLRFAVERQPGFGGKRHRLQAQRGPEHPKAAAAALRAARIPHPGHTPGLPWAPGDPPILILGGGIAGAACALAFHRRGIPCRVVDAAPEPAAGASGNPAGLVHAVVHREDGSHARLLRTAALYAARTYRPGLKAGWMNGTLEGLVRRVSQDPTQNLDALRALQQSSGLPEDLMQWVDAGAATGLSALNGEAACLFPDGGWIDPGAWVRTVMALDGIHWSGGQSVAAVEREAGEWVLRGADQVPIARAPWLVMAAAGGLRRILPSILHQSWPWGEVRGQITQVPGHEAEGSLPRLPVSGGGYGLTLAQPGGESALVCGATSHRNDTDPEVRDADHAANLSRWATLAGPMALRHRQQGPLQWNVDGLTGRVGIRFLTDDRLPLVGPLPDWTDAGIPAPAGPRLRDVRCAPGLLCCTALGSRGLTLAPLLGEVVASQLMGDPLPLPAALIEAIDPRRLALTGYRRTPS